LIGYKVGKVIITELFTYIYASFRRVSWSYRNDIRPSTMIVHFHCGKKLIKADVNHDSSSTKCRTSCGISCSPKEIHAQSK